MQIIDYKKESYLQKQRIKAGQRLNKTILIGLSVAAIILIIVVFIFRYSRQPRISWILILLVIPLLLILKNSDKKSSEERAIFDNWQKGDDGEKEVLEYLKQKFDDSWFYINNLEIPELKIGDIDGLLIGPKGIFILEIKNWSGSFRISGLDFYRHMYSDVYRFYHKNPLIQVNTNAEMLVEYLENKKEIKAPVMPILVLVSGYIEFISGTQKIDITELNGLDTVINHADFANLDPIYIEKLIDILVHNKCPRCGADLVKIHGQGYNDFLGCSNYKNGCLFKEEII